MPLNQGMGAGDPDNRMPAQKLNIIFPRYANNYQILQGGNHINPTRSKALQGFRKRLPLIRSGIGSQAGQLWKRLQGR